MTTIDVENGCGGAAADETDHQTTSLPVNPESHARADASADHRLPFLIVRCCGAHRDRLLSLSGAQDFASWFNHADKKQQHCYFNQTSSDLSLETIDKANPSTSTSSLFVSEGCVRDLECYCHEINSFKTSQRYLLDQIRSDRVVSTLPAEDQRRRTIIIERINNSFGFVLQTYGIYHKKDENVELLTYVDHVDVNGPAFKAGLREGDVILSINGQSMEKADHRSLVDYIQSCEKSMRMVVLFENCVLKVELHKRFIKLRKELSLRKHEYEAMCYREKQLLSKIKLNPAAKNRTTNEVNCTQILPEAQQPSFNKQSNKMDAVRGESTSGPAAVSLNNSSNNWTIPRCGIHATRDAVISQEPHAETLQSISLAKRTTDEKTVTENFNQQNNIAASSDNRHGQDFVTKL